MTALSHLRLDEAPDGLHVKVDCADLTDPCGAELTDELFALAERRGHERWYLDLDGVDHLSARFLTDLLRLDKRLRQAGGRLSLRNLNPLVYDIFHICRVTDLLDVALIQ